MRTLTFLALLPALGACSGGGTTMMCNGGFGGAGGVGGGGFAGGSLDPIGTVGKPLDVQLHLPRAGFICGNITPSDEVVVEVLDPANHAVAHTETSPVSDNFDGYTTTVTFTPPVSGSYHLSARFEPALGLTQLDVDVAVDRSAATLQAFKLPVTCDSLEMLSAGVLCKQPNDLRLYSNGLEVQRFSAEVYAVAGHALWVVSNGKVTRWLDVGGTLLSASPATAAATSLLSGSRTLIATEDQAVLVDASDVQQFKVTGASLTSQPLRTYGYAGDVFAAVADPGLQRLLVVGAQKLCRLNLGGGTLNDDCTALNAQPIAADATGAWSLEGTSIRHRSFGNPLDGPLALATLSLRDAPRLSVQPTHYESAPVVFTNIEQNRQLVLLRTAEGIVFEEYPAAEGFIFTYGSATLVRAQALDGRQRLFTR
jgi:hypothetical protein